MDLNYSAEEAAFRDEVRAWLQANLPGDLKEKVSLRSPGRFACQGTSRRKSPPTRTFRRTT